MGSRPPSPRSAVHPPARDRRLKGAFFNGLPGLKSPLAEPDIAFIDPAYTTITDEALYVLDRANERIVRAALEYHVEELVPLP